MQVPPLSVGQMRELERYHGYKAEPQGLLFEQFTREICMPSECTCFDVMHCVLATGGIAQFQTNQFLYDITQRTPITLKHIDDFAQTVKLPRSFSRLSKTFFSTRTRFEANKEMRAFAGEMISTVGVLRLLCVEVLAPMNIGVMGAHIRVMRILSELVDWLVQTKIEVLRQHLDRVDAIIEAYRAEAIPICHQVNRPKLHYITHITQHILRYSINVNCFAPERRHRKLKAILNHQAHIEKGSAIKRTTFNHIESMKDPLAFSPYYLVNPSKKTGVLPWWRRVSAKARSIARPRSAARPGQDPAPS